MNYIKTDPSETLNVPVEGGDFTVMVENAGNYNAYTDDDFYTVNPSENIAGNSSVLLTVNANTTNAERQGHLYFEAFNPDGTISTSTLEIIQSY